jgi:hypothetical protein
MSERVEGLVQQILASAKTRMSESAAQELADEVRAHLDASIQARLELGQTPEEAEQEAVASFGSTVSFVNSFLPHVTKTKRFDRATFIATLIVLVCGPALGVLVNANWSPLNAIAYYLPVIGGICAAAFLGWRFRRIQLTSLLAALVLAVPLAAISVSIFVIGDGSSNFVSKQELWFRTVQPEITKARIAEMRADLDAEQKLDAKIRVVQLRKFGKAPYGVAISTGAGQISSMIVNSAHDAKIIGDERRASVEAQWASELAGINRWAEDARQQLATPAWLNAARCLPAATQDTASLWLIVLISQAVAAAGGKLSRIRRRPIEATST